MTTSNQSIPIAIIGMAMNFPDSGTSATAFWKLLCEGRNVSKKVPKSRFNVDSFKHPDSNRHYSMYADGGHFLDAPLECFDAPFFNIGLAEAACMDPQQRILLETSYHALENAGITIRSCAGSDTAVYTGSFMDDYKSVMYADPELERRYAASGLATNMIANRISWFYDFKGPSVNLDTACSSSLTALHACCQDLRLGTASMGLVGGCSLVFGPDNFYTMTNMKFLSPDNRSQSFDEAANGYSRGEGFGMVVIKRLDDAIRDGDTIRAIIRATATGQDGRTPGITVPSGPAQRNLIEKTYEQAGLSMNSTRYCEAHATGTPVGDPIEANAIGETFSKYRSQSEPMILGSVKANIGHLEAASGLASLIKTVLVLENGIIPPVAGLKTLNSKIKAQDYHLHFPKQHVPWPSEGLRRACINSFGFGGSNAVAVLDDAASVRDDAHNVIHRSLAKPLTSRAFQCPQQDELNGVKPDQEYIIVLSALDQPSLNSYLANVQAYLRVSSPLTTSQFQDILYTASARRSKFPWRCALIASSDGKSDVAPILNETPVNPSKVSRSMFVFTGQGSQYEKMGLELMANPCFRQSTAKSSEYLASLGYPHSVKEILQGHTDGVSIDEAQNSQPLLTALQIALVDILRSYNLQPAVVLGHSSGEIAAAYCAGHLNREEALRAAFYRGKIVSEIRTTSSLDFGMMVVALSAAEAKELICNNCVGGEDRVVIACCNSPVNTTLSGLASDLKLLEKDLVSKGVFHKRLSVRIPYHSHFLSGLAETYRKYMGTFSETSNRKQHSPIMVSSVTGQAIGAETTATAQYWVDNMISTVRFSDALQYATETLAKKRRKRLGHPLIPQITIDDILEVGPHATLRSAIHESFDQWGHATKPSYLSCLRRGASASRSLLLAVGGLFNRGYPVDLLAVNQLPSEPRPLAVHFPPYSFNHSQEHWTESRISKAYRFRSLPRQEFLGVRNADWNPWEAQWRHQISAETDSWVRDHRINGEVLYPGAGWMVMALEASKQLNLHGDPIVGYRLQDVRFLNPLGVAENRNHECSITLRAIAAVEINSVAYDFTVYTHGETSTTELCAGRISVVKDAENARVLSHATAQHLSEDFSENQMKDARLFYGDEIYGEVLPTNGATYGPAFRALEEMQVTLNGRATAIMNTRGWMSGSKSAQASSFVIHPAVLDSLFHVIFPGFQPHSDIKKAVLPSRIGHLWISSDLNGACTPELLRAGGEVRPRGFRGVEGNVIVTVPGQKEILVAMEKAELTFLRSSKTTSSAGQDRNLISEMIWAPDIASMSSSQLALHCNQQTGDMGERSEMMRKIDLVARFFIHDLLDESALKIDESRPWLQNYMQWINSQARRPDVDMSKLDSLKHNAKAREEMLREVESSSHQGALVVNIGKQLRQILHGNVDALDIIFYGRLGQDFYSEALGAGAYVPRIQAFLELLTHRNPSLYILEVGAGTASCTALILKALQTRGYPSFSRYHFTDISAAFFSAAQTRFEDIADRMTYSVFDIEADHLSQGFEEASHDLIIAGDVLHATQDLDDVLRRMRALIKPGGHLMLFEITNRFSVRAPLAMGLLEGWWRQQNAAERLGPTLSSEEWDCALRKAGFEGVQLEFGDGFEGDLRENSVLVARAPLVEVFEEETPAPWIILKDGHVPEQSTLGDKLSRILEKHGLECSSMDLDTLAQKTELCKTHAIVSLLDINSAFLMNLGATAFEKLQRILVQTQTILWATSPQSRQFGSNARLVDGFARCLRSENPRLKFVVAHLEQGFMHQAGHLDTIVAQMMSLDLTEMEHEFRVRNGDLEINRVMPSPKLDQQLAKRLVPSLEEMIRVESGPSLKLEIGSYGQPQSLFYSEQTEQLMKSTGFDLSVRSRAFGFTHRDYLVVSGHLNELELCFAASGVVEDTTAGSGFEIKDRVCVVGPYVSQTQIHCQATQVVKIPDSVSFAAAASLAVPAMIAFRSLVEIARLESGDSILIHQASGAVGQVCLQLALHLEATIFVTVGTHVKKDFLLSNYRLRPDHILTPRNFQRQTSLLTNGQGVTAVVNCVDSTVEGSMQCLAQNGTFIDLNLTSKISQDRLAPGTMHKNAVYAKINLPDMWRNHPAKAARLFKKSWEMVEKGVLKPPEGLFTAEIGHEAELVQRYGDTEHIGPSAVVIEEDSTAKAWVANKPTYMLDANATYVVAGAFGGLGRVITGWLVGRGARYLVLLSRSGRSSASAAAFCNELEGLGVSVYAPACDISSSSAVAEAFDHCRKHMPEIRGCVQSSVVYRDSVFENMSFADWEVCLAPKVSGSQNLISILPSCLDFFIFISSVSGIQGSRSQANYAAANAYMDALARELTSSGKQPRAAAIDLGMMVDDGYVAETAGMLDRLRKIGHWQDLTAKDFQGLLDHFCDPQRAVPDEQASQAVIGLELPVTMLNKGVELPVAMQRPQFRHFYHVLPAGQAGSSAALLQSSAGESANHVTKSLLQAAASDDEAAKIIHQALEAKLENILGSTQLSLDDGVPLHAVGVDSLMGIDLRTWLDVEVGAEMQTFELLGDNTIGQIVRLAVGRSGWYKGGKKS